MTSLMSTDAFPMEAGFAIALVGLIVLGALLVVVLIIAAVFSILLSPLDLGMKIVWLILVILAPFLGALLWFLIGRSRADRPNHVAHG